jgi:hypothetical protein
VAGDHPGRVPNSALVEEARRFPGGWVYEIDGTFGPDDVVPPEAIRGRGLSGSG